jgi:hypothetical protein
MDQGKKPTCIFQWPGGACKIVGVRKPCPINMVLNWLSFSLFSGACDWGSRWFLKSLIL